MKLTVEELIKESPYTQKEISKRIGMSEQHFCSNIKGNYGRLKVNQFAIFAEMLELNLEQLWRVWELETIKNK